MKDWATVEAEAGAQEALLRLRGRYRLVVATNAEDSPAADVRLALAQGRPGRVRRRRHLLRRRRRPQAQLRLLPRGAPARGRPRSPAGPAPGRHGRRRDHQRHRRRAAGRHPHHLVQPHQAPVPRRGTAAGRRDPQARASCRRRWTASPASSRRSGPASSARPTRTPRPRPRRRRPQDLRAATAAEDSAASAAAAIPAARAERCRRRTPSPERRPDHPTGGSHGPVTPRPVVPPRPPARRRRGHARRRRRRRRRRVGAHEVPVRLRRAGRPQDLPAQPAAGRGHAAAALGVPPRRAPRGRPHRRQRGQRLRVPASQRRRPGARARPLPRRATTRRG